MDTNFVRNMIEKSHFYEDAEDKENFKYDSYEVISEDKLKEKAHDYLLEYLDNYIDENITNSFIKDNIIIDKDAFIKNVYSCYDDIDILGIEYVDYDLIRSEEEEWILKFYYVFEKDEIPW